MKSAAKRASTRGPAAATAVDGMCVNFIIVLAIISLLAASAHSLMMAALRGGGAVVFVDQVADGISDESSGARQQLLQPDSEPNAAAGGGGGGGGERELGGAEEDAGEEQEGKSAGEDGAGGNDGDEGEGGKKTEDADALNLCRGIEHMELWGSVTAWGKSNKVNNSQECCQRCKERCKFASHCHCNAWVYCGDKEKCGEQFQECWLKNQKDPLHPEVRASNPSHPWTSGLYYGEGVGIVRMLTPAGDFRFKLKVGWAPLTVAYIRDLARVKYCQGCHFYRAEARGNRWKWNGKRTEEVISGPPYGLLQGTLRADGVLYTKAKEGAPKVKRGHMGLIDGGPDFFVSLGDHEEWGHSYTVFGVVLAEDMAVVERIAALQTRVEEWGGVDVWALKEPLNFSLSLAASQTTS